MYKVYSIDSSHQIDLTEHFSGTYYACKKWIDTRAKNGYSNFYLISKKSRTDLLKKYR